MTTNLHNNNSDNISTKENHDVNTANGNYYGIEYLQNVVKTASTSLSKTFETVTSTATSITNTAPVIDAQESAQKKQQDRIKLFEDAISEPKIKWTKILELSFEGIPDSLRSAYWKLLLGYLPAERDKWEEVTKKKRVMYKDWVTELIIDPHDKPKGEILQTHVASDHPLSQANDSTWNVYFKDKEMMFEIEKDVKRTFPYLHFFNRDDSSSSQHYEAIKRLLFIYAKLNPGIAYVQGMNEILAPLYYVFASNPDHEWSKNAEADTFFCFTSVMGEIMNNFIKTLDKADVGIMGTIQKLNKLLKQKDYELWANLEDKKTKSSILQL